MTTLNPAGTGGARATRRALYRRLKRILRHGLSGRWCGPRGGLEAAIRRALRPCTRRDLAMMLRDRRMALAAVATALTTGTAAVAGPPIDLADVADGTGGFIMNGIDAEDFSGIAVAHAGDVNGDGLADVLVAAPGGDPDGVMGAGEAYLVFGTADTTPVDLADVAAGAGGFGIFGIDPNGNTAYSVAGAGDVNGDGLDDVMVGVSNGSPDGQSATGETYVVFGKADTGPVHLVDVAAGTGGFVINGIDPGDRSGDSVSGAGDVNGDGLDDLIVGAPAADPGERDGAGESYVVFGTADTTPIELADVATGSGGFVINGIDPGDFSGANVSDAGDVNGDGLNDVVIGAYAASPGGVMHAGESYVVFGTTDTTPVELADVAGGSGGFVINGIDPDDLSGASVSGAGDVNGDGLNDVVIGAGMASHGGVLYAGESYVVFGKADTTPVDLADVAGGSGGFVINGTNSLDRSGASLSGAGDVDGDGLDDVIIGAPGVDSSRGAGYVVFGTTDTTPVELADVADGFGGFIIRGINSHDLAGLSVSGGGDVNGDGLDDLIIGAPGADPGGSNHTGESYVVFGMVDVPPPPPCTADLDGDGDVDAADLAILLSQWGPCDPG